MHIMYAGAVGSGKTLGALKFMLDCPGNNVRPTLIPMPIHETRAVATSAPNKDKKK